MKTKPKVGDLLKYDDHSYCIVIEQDETASGVPFWNIRWLMAVDPLWYRDEQSQFYYYMDHFSLDSWVNLTA